MKDWIFLLAIITLVLVAESYYDDVTKYEARIAQMQTEMDNATKHLQWANNRADAAVLALKRRPVVERKVYYELP